MPKGQPVEKNEAATQKALTYIRGSKGQEIKSDRAPVEKGTAAMDLAITKLLNYIVASDENAMANQAKGMVTHLNQLHKFHQDRSIDPTANNEALISINNIINAIARLQDYLNELKSEGKIDKDVKVEPYFKNLIGQFAKFKLQDDLLRKVVMKTGYGADIGISKPKAVVSSSEPVSVKFTPPAPEVKPDKPPKPPKK